MFSTEITCTSPFSVEFSLSRSYFKHKKNTRDCKIKNINMVCYNVDALLHFDILILVNGCLISPPSLSPTPPTSSVSLLYHQFPPFFYSFETLSITSNIISYHIYIYYIINHKQSKSTHLFLIITYFISQFPILFNFFQLV